MRENKKYWKSDKFYVDVSTCLSFFVIMISIIAAFDKISMRTYMQFIGGIISFMCLALYRIMDRPKRAKRENGKNKVVKSECEQKVYRALDVAEYVIWQYSQLKEKDRSMTRLHAILYFLQEYYLHEIGRPLFEDDFIMKGHTLILGKIYGISPSFSSYQISSTLLGYVKECDIRKDDRDRIDHLLKELTKIETSNLLYEIERMCEDEMGDETRESKVLLKDEILIAAKLWRRDRWKTCDNERNGDFFYDIETIAEYIIWKDSEINRKKKGFELTLSRMQAILYVLQQNCLTERGSRLFNGDITEKFIVPKMYALIEGYDCHLRDSVFKKVEKKPIVRRADEKRIDRILSLLEDCSTQEILYIVKKEYKTASCR